MIEQYSHDGEGYNPFMIRPGFQVAKLNYVAGHGLDDLTDVEAHNETDEAFILLDGTGILVEAEVEEWVISMKCVKMKKGIVYNVPRGIWHNIAMSEDAQLYIVEKDNTHLNDVHYKQLTENQMSQLSADIARACRL